MLLSSQKSSLRIWVPVVLVVVTIFVLLLPLFSFAQQKITIEPPTRERMENGGTSHTFLIFLGLLPSLIIKFGVLCLIIWIGFRIFQIKGISKVRVGVFIITLLILPILLSLFLLKFPGLTESNSVVWLLGKAVLFIISFLFIRYYLGISGRKLWKFFSYFVVVTLILSFILLVDGVK